MKIRLNVIWNGLDKGTIIDPDPPVAMLLLADDRASLVEDEPEVVGLTPSNKALVKGDVKGKAESV